MEFGSSDGQTRREFRYRASYEALIDRSAYDYFVTLTFQDAYTRQAADRALARYLKRLEARCKTDVWCVTAFETAWDGRHLHLHCLIGAGRVLGTDALRQEWRHGHQVRVEPYDPRLGAVAYLSKGLISEGSEIEFSERFDEKAREGLIRRAHSIEDRSCIRRYQGTDVESDNLLISFDRLYEAPWTTHVSLRFGGESMDIREALTDLIVALSGRAQVRVFGWGPINPNGSVELLIGGCDQVPHDVLAEVWPHGTARTRPYRAGLGPTRNFSDPLAVIELSRYESPAFHEFVREARHRLRCDEANADIEDQMYRREPHEPIEAGA